MAKTYDDETILPAFVERSLEDFGQGTKKDTPPLPAAGVGRAQERIP
jgi:hypothetical protein